MPPGEALIHHGEGTHCRCLVRSRNRPWRNVSPSAVKSPGVTTFWNPPLRLARSTSGRFAICMFNVYIQQFVNGSEFVRAARCTPGMALTAASMAFTYVLNSSGLANSLPGGSPGSGNVSVSTLLDTKPVWIFTRPTKLLIRSADPHTYNRTNATATSALTSASSNRRLAAPGVSLRVPMAPARLTFPPRRAGSSPKTIAVTLEMASANTSTRA